MAKVFGLTVITRRYAFAGARSTTVRAKIHENVDNFNFVLRALVSRAHTSEQRGPRVVHRAENVRVNYTVPGPSGCPRV